MGYKPSTSMTPFDHAGRRCSRFRHSDGLSTECQYSLRGQIHNTAQDLSLCPIQQADPYQVMLFLGSRALHHASSRHSPSTLCSVMRIPLTRKDVHLPSTLGTVAILDPRALDRHVALKSEPRKPPNQKSFTSLGTAAFRQVCFQATLTIRHHHHVDERFRRIPCLRAAVTEAGCRTHRERILP